MWFQHQITLTLPYVGGAPDSVDKRGGASKNPPRNQQSSDMLLPKSWAYMNMLSYVKFKFKKMPQRRDSAGAVCNYGMGMFFNVIDSLFFF